MEGMTDLELIEVLVHMTVQGRVFPVWDAVAGVARWCIKETLQGQDIITLESAAKKEGWPEEWRQFYEEAKAEKGDGS